MTGLPAQLLKKLRETLLDCGPFDTHRSLAGVFTDDRIAPWKNQISEADSKNARVDVFVSDFLSRKNRAGQSVLVLFLQAVYDRAEEEDDCYQRLNDLAIEVAAALGTGLPPLARNNLWRASAVSTGAAPPTNLGSYAPPPAEADPSAQVAVLPPGLPAQVFAEQLESLKDQKKADWLPASFLEKGLQAARAVGRVEYQGRKIGTAFALAPDLVLTNAHVVQHIPVLEEGGVRFNVGLQAEAQWHYFAEQLAYSPIDALDFALLRLKSPIAGTPLTLSIEATYPAQPANILQYPEGTGGLMQVALRYNAIVHVDATRLYYVADTAGGSSGSPVFNDDWRVIGLHRAGMVDDTQRPVPNANQGVPLTAIEPLIRRYLAGRRYQVASASPALEASQPPADPYSHITAVQVLAVLDAHFNISELNDLCFEMGVDFDNLGGSGKKDKARELIQFCQRRGRFAELVQRVRQARPHVAL
jgi:V8-like Glu-specific endopeptidase